MSNKPLYEPVRRDGVFIQIENKTPRKPPVDELRSLEISQMRILARKRPKEFLKIAVEVAKVAV